MAVCNWWINDFDCAIIVYVNKNNKVCSVLPASLDCPFWLPLLVISNIYLHRLYSQVVASYIWHFSLSLNSNTNLHEQSDCKLSNFSPLFCDRLYVSDFADSSEVDSMVLYFSRSFDGRTMSGVKQYNYLSYFKTIWICKSN